MPKTPCKAKTATGDPCKAQAGPGGLCFFHANPDRARTLGQMGGRKNRHRQGIEIQVPTKMTLDDLRELTSQTIGAVLNGELQAREADAVARLLVVQNSLLSSIDLEQRMASLERKVVKGVLPPYENG